MPPHPLPPQPQPAPLALKRLLDLGLGATLLVLAAPLMALVALVIRVQDGGPVLYRQPRVGRDGRPFVMLKFRTMRPHAHADRDAMAHLNEVSAPAFKMQRDPRVTPAGRVLRRFFIDELPQLINVLRGEMSLVGPRPPLPEEVAHYEPWQLRRLSVLPGLTCSWQVSGPPRPEFQDWVRLDLHYIDHWSLGLDLLLLLRTVPVVLFGLGGR